MTHNESEQGKRLTIHNANKAQLKWMIEDRDAAINRLYNELERKNATLQECYALLSDIITKYCIPADALHKK